MKKQDSYEFSEPLNPKSIPHDSKLKKLQKILLFSFPIILLFVAGGYFFLFVINDLHSAKDVVTTEEKKELNITSLKPNIYLDIDPITVSLNPSNAKREYLRLTLTIKVSSKEESNVITSFMPAIKDTLISFLGSLRSIDFNSSKNTIYLKEEITKRINKIVAPIIVKEILFQELVVN